MARCQTRCIDVLWLGQAGFVLRGGGTTLVVDPFLSDRPDRRAPPPIAPQDLTGVDAILATHEHRDHMDLPTWPRLAAASPAARFVVPAPLVERAAEVVPRDRLIGAVVGREIAIGASLIVPVPARHGVHVADAYTFGQELSGGLHRYLGYVVKLGGLRAYHAGDTIAYEGLPERLRGLAADLALLPINGRDPAREALDLVGNLNYAEAADLAAAARIPLLIPMHYEMFAKNSEDPGKLVSYAAARHPGLTIVVLGQGAALTIEAPLGPEKAVRHILGPRTP